MQLRFMFPDPLRAVSVRPAPVSFLQLVQPLSEFPMLAVAADFVGAMLLVIPTQFGKSLFELPDRGRTELPSLRGARSGEINLVDESQLGQPNNGIFAELDEHPHDAIPAG